MMYNRKKGKMPENERSLWHHLSDAIYISARRGDDLLIKELLDKYDDCNQNF